MGREQEESQEGVVWAPLGAGRVGIHSLTSVSSLPPHVTKMAVSAGVPVGLNNAPSGKSQGEMDTGFSLTEVLIKSLFRMGSCRYVAAKDGVGVWD